MEYLTDADYEIAKENGISKLLAYNRLYQLGWDKNRTITQPVREKLGPWEQHKNKSLVKKSTFYERMKKGMAPDEAAQTPPMPRTHKHITVLTKERIELAKENGITYNTLAHRVYYYKWPVEKAITQPVNDKLRRKDLKVSVR
jgi:hypothetical protein